jgi:hypothetical protein
LGSDIFVKDRADNKLHSVARYIADDGICGEHFVLSLHHLPAAFYTILLGHSLSFVVLTRELIQNITVRI